MSGLVPRADADRYWEASGRYCLPSSVRGERCTLPAGLVEAIRHHLGDGERGRRTYARSSRRGSDLPRPGRVREPSSLDLLLDVSTSMAGFLERAVDLVRQLAVHLGVSEMRLWQTNGAFVERCRLVAPISSLPLRGFEDDEAFVMSHQCRDHLLRHAVLVAGAPETDLAAAFKAVLREHPDCLVVLTDGRVILPRLGAESRHVVSVVFGEAPVPASGSRVFRVKVGSR